MKCYEIHEQNWHFLSNSEIAGKNPHMKNCRFLIEIQ
jgi:hypothetical protein